MDEVSIPFTVTPTDVAAEGEEGSVVSTAMDLAVTEAYWTAF